MLKIDIAVFDGFDELDVVGPLEVLRRAGFDVRLAAPDGGASVHGAHGLVMHVDGKLRDDAGLVIFPGGGWSSRAAQGVRAEVSSGRWVPWIQTTVARGATLASVCTGAMILASAGVLNKRRASTHHAAHADLEAAGAIVLDDRVVDDGDVITAGGVTSGIDLGLHIVERFAGAELAARIAEDLEYRRRQGAC